jgi:hypothetical protein
VGIAASLLFAPSYNFYLPSPAGFVGESSHVPMLPVHQLICTCCSDLDAGKQIVFCFRHLLLVGPPVRQLHISWRAVIESALTLLCAGLAPPHGASKQFAHASRLLAVLVRRPSWPILLQSDQSRECHTLTKCCDDAWRCLKSRTESVGSIYSVRRRKLDAPWQHACWRLRLLSDCKVQQVIIGFGKSSASSLSNRRGQTNRLAVRADLEGGGCSLRNWLTHLIESLTFAC